MFNTKIKFTGNDILPIIAMSFFFYFIITIFSPQVNVILPLLLSPVFSLIVMIVSMVSNWKRPVVMMYLALGGVGCFLVIMDNIPRENSLRVIYAVSASAFILLYSIATNLKKSAGPGVVLLKRLCLDILLPLCLALLFGNFAFTGWDNDFMHRIMMGLTCFFLAYAYSAFIYSKHLFWVNLILYFAAPITMAYLYTHSDNNSSPALLSFYQVGVVTFTPLILWLLSTHMKKGSLNLNSDKNKED